MKRFYSIIICLILSLSVEAQTLNEVRSEFHEVVLKPENSKDFHKYMSGIDSKSSTIRAYQAVSEAVLAQVLWNPFTKLSQVVKYDKLIGGLVEEDPSNIEIRFLRLAIEYNLPPFLGMSTHIEEDSQMIIQNMSRVNDMNIEKTYGNYIFHFLSETDLVTQSEISLMQESLSMN